MRRRLLASLALAVTVAFIIAPTARADVSTLSFIVTLDHPPTTDDLDVLGGVALGVHGYKHLPMASVVVAPSSAGILARLPGVRGVYPNRTLQHSLNRATRTTHADRVWSELSYDGSGVGVAVIDAGVDGTHPDLCARVEFCRGTPVKTVQNVKIIGRQSVAEPVVVVPDQVSTDSSSGHGSHVAGIVGGYGTASLNNPGKYRGMAPGAGIIGLGTGEVLEVDTVLAGFDYVLEHKDDYNIKVINNSWGPGPGYQFDPNEPVQVAIAAAYDRGMSVVFGAGNGGPMTDSMNAFSVNPKAISAAAGQNNGQLAIFSSRGVPGSALWHPTVTATGQMVTSVRATTGFYADAADAQGGNLEDPVDPSDAPVYATASGTSMASPVVAGAIALMQQASFESRGVYLTPEQVKNILQNTASKAAAGMPHYQQHQTGAGYLDAFAATQAAAAGSHMEPYDDGITYDVRGFGGQVGPAAFIPLQSFETTFTVAPGATSLEITADWTVIGNDVDLDIFNPSGAQVWSTFLNCSTTPGPNQYSSFCHQQPNERVGFVSPAAGRWRAVVHGSFSATDTVTGVWSAAYPDAVAPAGATAATVTLTPPTGPQAMTTSAAITATVRDAAGSPLPNASLTWSASGVGRILYGETQSRADGTALGSIRSDVPGDQTITVTSGGATASVTVGWAGVGLPAPPTTPSSTPGKAAGGGFVSNPAKQNFGFWGEYRAGWARPSGEVSIDDKNGHKVQATELDLFTRSGTTAALEGPATLGGVSGYRVRIEVADNGTPGRNADTFRLILTKVADPLFRWETSGTLAGGNLTVAA